MEGVSREWLQSNGLGGYASSTICGCNTRAYHGLLVAALHPPVDRWLLLSSLDEEIDDISLANHQYPGVIHPQGWRHLLEFRLDPWPRFRYHMGGCSIEKTVFLARGENTVVVSYRIKNGKGRMRIVPLLHSRSFHAASRLPGFRQKLLAAGTVIQSACRPDIALSLLSDGPEYVPFEAVYYNFEYEEERRRGLAWREDLFAPGRFELELSGDHSFALAASTDICSMPNWRSMQRAEKARLHGLASPVRKLAQAADSFLVKRGNSMSILAGYHWFDDWGRDAMISLSGLLLASGRQNESREVLRSFAAAMNDGVLPNDLGASSYNTVDASLWFVRALDAYFGHFSDRQFLEEMWPRLTEIFHRYTRPGHDFGAAEDGLIASGPAMTWMDARVDGRPVTPRTGKCCEINSLWYFALLCMKRLHRASGNDRDLPDPGFLQRAKMVKDGYQRFWNSEAGCLFDVIDPIDASIRPNQIIAAGMADLLPDVMKKGIFEVVTEELLTPFGLRTLSPRDPHYVGRYAGGPRERDACYHQGTVWPWLIGPYIDALLSVRGRSRPVLAQGRRLLSPLLKLQAGGIETLPEVFDGDIPHRPGGCISQAWSVAEVLRAWQACQ
jgi:predicted glycogen debranching enzyme